MRRERGEMPWASSLGRCARPGEGVWDRGAGPADAGVLTDPIGRRITYLRLSLLEACNLRCTYCRPAEEAGVPSRPPAMRREEIVRIARLFVGLGVVKVRLTGGEPTLHPDLVGIVSDIASLTPAPPALALTTNGVLLARLAPQLRAAGLARVNVSLDATTREAFAALTGRDRLDAVRAGLDAALAAGFEKVKINAVVLAGVNEDQILPLALLARDLPVDVRFIEYMPLGGATPEGAHVPSEEIERRLSELTLSPCAKDEHAGPARMVTAEGFRGRIGFIAPFSVPFCSDCNRVRVTARGALRICLLGGGEADLLGPMRAGAGDEELAAVVRDALGGKRERHPVAAPSGGLPACANGPAAVATPMWAVGG